MTAPDRIGPPCEYCQMPQAEDDDGYGHCWTCQNPNCKGRLGYIRELERAAIARATPAAMTPEVATETQIDAALDAVQGYMREQQEYIGVDWREFPPDEMAHLRASMKAGLVAALRAGGQQ